VLVLPHDPIVLHLNVFNLGPQVSHLGLSSGDGLAQALERRDRVLVCVGLRMGFLYFAHLLDQLESIEVDFLVKRPFEAPQRVLVVLH